jgi:hypothetical protein
VAGRNAQVEQKKSVQIKRPNMFRPVLQEDRPTHNPLFVPIQLPDTASLLAQAEADAVSRFNTSFGHF